MYRSKTNQPLSQLKVTAAAILFLLISQAYAQSGDWCHYTSGTVNYGTYRQESITVTPGGRSGSVSGWDHQGNFLVFGGTLSPGGATNSLFRYNLSNGQWSWIHGSKNFAQPSTYGTKGVPDPANTPGNRDYPVSWTDGSGNFWILGGTQIIASPVGHMADLWKFDSMTSQWTWVAGPNLANSPANFGTRGTTSSTNDPGARQQATSWRVTNGDLWLFGGNVHMTTTSLATLNDLWRFDGTNWTWMKGTNLAGHPGTYGTKGVEAPANTPSS